MVTVNLHLGNNLSKKDVKSMHRKRIRRATIYDDTMIVGREVMIRIAQVGASRPITHSALGVTDVVIPNGECSRGIEH